MTADNFKVVIVDDDPIYLSWLISVVKSYAPNTVGFESPEEALGYLEIEQPNLLIMDINMPVLDGTAMCDVIRKKESLKNLPIVLISGDSSIGDFSLYFKGVDFIKKPLDFQELLNKVKLYTRLSATQDKLTEILDSLDNSFDRRNK